MYYIIERKLNYRKVRKFLNTKISQTTVRMYLIVHISVECKYACKSDCKSDQHTLNWPRSECDVQLLLSWYPLQSHMELLEPCQRSRCCCMVNSKMYMSFYKYSNTFVRIRKTVHHGSQHRGRSHSLLCAVGSNCLCIAFH